LINLSFAARKLTVTTSSLGSGKSFTFTERSLSEQSVLSPAHGDEDVDGRRRQHDPDGDHDVVERNVVDVVQLEAEHDLRGQLQDGANEIPATNYLQQIGY